MPLPWKDFVLVKPLDPAATSLTFADGFGHYLHITQSVGNCNKSSFVPEVVDDLLRLYDPDVLSLAKSVNSMKNFHGMAVLHIPCD